MIKKNYLVEKRNILNELRCNNMHLQELRFFTIYLAKIDARRPKETRKVRFSLSEFLAIMEIGKANISAIKETINNLLCKVVKVPLDSGGFTTFQLFKECTVDKSKNDDTWYIEIDAHNKSLPLMFDFKREYFTYELWNALRLSSVNQLRMYEILKQYEKKGERTIPYNELKTLLYIDEKEYIRFDNFKSKVLNTCRIALKEHTDICYEYELIKAGRGGKVSEIRFIINKNSSYIDQLTLSEFINMKNYDDIQTDEEDFDEIETEDTGINYSFFSEALEGEFSLKEVELLYQLSLDIVRQNISTEGFKISMYNYLLLKYKELNTKKNVKYRFNYLKKLIKLDNID